jgi:alpha-glucosidase (family GH31 glycosyl hydrolase)
MYKLGEHFNADYKQATAVPESVIQGEKYRITLLTERLIRFEYNENGLFEDRPTEFALKRDFKTPTVEIKEDKKYLEIRTAYLTLFYRKGKKFKGNIINKKQNLFVKDLQTSRVWYYNHPEARNLKAPGYAFDQNDGKVGMIKGLYSVDGFVSIDDSKTNIIEETGTMVPRDKTSIDTYLFVYGNDYLLGLKDYFDLTGHPAFIPRYALGNWWSKNESYNDLELKKLVTEFEENEIPLSVLLLNSDWHKKVNDNDNGFTWNNDNFKNPTMMINYLHSKGIRMALNVDPTKGFNQYETQYSELTKYINPAIINNA